MERSWSFGQKLAAGFALNVLFTGVVGLVALVTLDDVSATREVVDTTAHGLVLAADLNAAMEQKSAAGRGFLLTTNPDYLDQAGSARAEFQAITARLLDTARSAEEHAVVIGIQEAEAAHQAGVETLFARRRGDVPLTEIADSFERDIRPLRVELAKRVEVFTALEEAQLAAANEVADEQVVQRRTLLVGIIVSAAVLAALSAAVLTRALTRQIGNAVQQVRSSAAELQTAANQQATGTREQATAMTEITTTINELLATSRQIAESAQRVAHVAGETASAARTGDETVGRAKVSIESTKRQVDTIVTHMLDLGRKSQQIGGILDIVSELSDQTNILAINATIEAAGAGEAGRRFGVVADEIRKLADRVGASTKEIRGLIGEVRAAVNTTVMATESGSKAADAGARQFEEVTTSLVRIGGLVGTTTEAAREIVLSTKQQATAVEQVNIAIVSVTQASRESEASSGQTLQTATELARLSRELTQIVRQNANG
ncbi:MAG: methyl-accepting chemotaxis protein [Myxococcota bacterium]